MLFPPSKIVYAFKNYRISGRGYHTSTDCLLGVTADQNPYLRARISQDEEMRKKAASERLAKLRQSLCLTLEEVGTAVGITTSQIYDYESGRTSPHPFTLVRLAEFYGVPTDYIAGITNTRERKR